MGGKRPGETVFLDETCENRYNAFICVYGSGSLPGEGASLTLPDGRQQSDADFYGRRAYIRTIYAAFLPEWPDRQQIAACEAV